MSVNYSQGDWTVKSLYNDTLQTPKSLSLPDLDYSSDYAKVIDDPGEARIANKTASGLTTPETIRFAQTSVTNIYNNTNVDPTMFAPSKRGVQVMAEVEEFYSATNSKSGAEVVLPCKGRIVLRFPSGGAVGADLVTDLLERTVAAILGTGEVNVNRVLELARGSMLPDQG